MEETTEVRVLVRLKADGIAPSTAHAALDEALLIFERDFREQGVEVIGETLVTYVDTYREDA